MVKRVFKLVYSEIRGLHQAAYVLAFFALGSQMLALVRDRLLAHTFGAGSELDLYYAAFRIPDVMFALFASVLSVYVLLPFVTKAKNEADTQAASVVLGQVFTLFVLVYSVCALVLFILAPYLVTSFFPGFTTDAETLTLLIRILLLQPFLLGVSSLLGVVTQMSQRFVLYAISPLVYNLGILFGIVFLYPTLGMAGLVSGVVFGALCHALIQLPLVFKSGYAFGFVKKIEWLLISKILLFAFPRAITLSIHQVVLLLFMGLATVMTVGSVSVFQFAFNLQSVPLAIIGMSYSVAAFPVLVDLFTQQKREAFENHIISAVRHILFWSLPAIALIVVLRAQIVRVLLGSGEFNWNDTRLTAAMLALFVVSLVAQALMLLLVRAFYAGGNTKTPLTIATLGAFMTMGLAVYLVRSYESLPGMAEQINSLFRLGGVVGAEVLILASVYSLGAVIETVLLMVMAARHFGIKWHKAARTAGEGLLAALVAGGSAYLTLLFVVDGINQETFIGILLQGLVAGVLGILGGVSTYAALGSKELREMYTSLRSRIFKTNVIAPQSDSL